MQINEPGDNQVKQPISFFWSAAPFAIIILLLGIGAGVYHLNVSVLLLLSAAITGCIALAHGLSWKDMEAGIVEKLATSMPASLILTSVGALIGAWMFSGTIPMMIYYGIKVIHPDYIVVSSFVIAAIVSTVTGTSWGSVGTIGVALIGIAFNLGAPLPMTAGAIVAGAYFGDKMSPLSDSTNLASLVTGANLYEHIRHLLYTTLPIFFLSIVLYSVMGRVSQSAVYVTPAKVQENLNALEHIYQFGAMSFVLLIPALIVIVGSIRKMPTVPIMLFSAAVAFLIGLFVQGFAFKDGVNALVNGFDLRMIEAKIGQVGLSLQDIPADINRLLTRGGMMSMMNTMLIVFCAFGFAGIASKAGMLETILRAITNKVSLNRGPLILSTVMSCIIIAFTTGASYLSLIIPAEMFSAAYRKAGLHAVNLSRTIEDAGTVVVPIIPWSMAGIYMSTQLGVSVIEYAPYAFLCYGCFILAVIYGFTGIAIRKIDD